MKKRKLNPESKPLEITLPKEIKDQIKDNVSQLKELLKDDEDFCIKLIKGILAVGYSIPGYPIPGLPLPSDSTDRLVIKHYWESINQCAKEYKPWDIKVTKVRDIVNFLSTLTSGYAKLLFDIIKNQGLHTDYDDLIKNSEKLGDLCRIEVGIQFNSDVNYYDKIVQEFEDNYETLIAGAAIDDNEDL